MSPDWLFIGLRGRLKDWLIAIGGRYACDIQMAWFCAFGLLE